MPVFEVLSNAVAWLPWGAAAFSRARADHKPVLLSLTATWCGSCREMERTTYGDPSIATLINRRFVPVRVDVDERPDIGERYGLGGWPTTAFLTPGGSVLGGGPVVPHDRMTSVLGRVADAFAARTGEQDELFPETQSPAAGALLSAAELMSGVFAAFDEEHGGFGAAPKFPLAAPLQLALDLVRHGEESPYRQIAEATLDAMGWGGLYDDVEGGFFRFARARDW